MRIIDYDYEPGVDDDPFRERPTSKFDALLRPSRLPAGRLRTISVPTGRMDWVRDWFMSAETIHADESAEDGWQ